MIKNLYQCEKTWIYGNKILTMVYVCFLQKIVSFEEFEE